MIVSEIMTTDVSVTPPAANLDTAIHLMMERECGFLPVVDTRSRLVGVVTDRDICFAIASHRRTPAHILVEEAMKHPVVTCSSDDLVSSALKTMRQHRIRRLPVLNKLGHMQGVLSMDDVVASRDRNGAPASEEILSALHATYPRRSLQLAPE